MAASGQGVGRCGECTSVQQPEEREMQILAAFVHGTLCSMHLLGLVYNLRRRNGFDSTVHALGVIYDSVSTYKHIKAATEG